MTWLESLYHTLETLEVYGERAVYAYIEAMQRNNDYLWNRVRDNAALGALFDDLNAKYSCDLSNVVVSAEEAWEISLGRAPRVSCCVVLGKGLLQELPTREKRIELLEGSHPKIEHLLHAVEGHIRGEGISSFPSARL